MKTGKAALFSEINITPLTDIFLVLLIIMMVVAPMMQQTRADIKPPDVSSGSAVKQGLLTVEVTRDGQYYLNGEPVAEADLAQALSQKKPPGSDKGSDKGSTVLIRADKTTKSAAVLAVLSAARDARFDKVTVAGQSLTQARQNDLSQGNRSVEETP